MVADSSYTNIRFSEHKREAIYTRNTHMELEGGVSLRNRTKRSSGVTGGTAPGDTIQGVTPE